MKWDDLQHFLAVCRTGSVTAAGRLLSVNHTTVARRIAALEADLGVRLFDRTRDGYGMTQSAEEMYAQAEQVEESVRAIDRRMFGRDAALKGPLKLTAHSEFANAILAPELHRFHTAYPGIDLELLTTNAVLDLSAREADLAVRFARKLSGDLVGKRLITLGVGIYCSTSYLRRLKRESPRVIINRSFKPPSWVRHHFPDARVVIKADDVGTIAAAVRHGAGIGSLPCMVGDADPKLRRIDIEVEYDDVGVWMVNHVDLRTTARVRAAREFIADVVEQSRDRIAGENSRYASLP